MTKYLYGASVQGIQGFIFETNKLSEIAGASELVEQICTTLFQNAVGKHYQLSNAITKAAGNIKYVFEDNENQTAREQCQQLVYHFPKEVMTHAPGVTISQAVVEFEGDLTVSTIKKLEDKLRIQRSKSITQHGLSKMITERSRRTGKAGVCRDKKVVQDDGQRRKTDRKEDGKNKLLEKMLGENHNIQERHYPYDIEKLVNKKDNAWIAVVHADGNNLGKLILEMTNNLSDEQTQEAFKLFSERLDRATTLAAQQAFDDTMRHRYKSNETLPMRPVILGGDDLTLIIRGDLAIEFTQNYLRCFEKHTKIQFADFYEKFGLKGFENGLTACAGIAFIKYNYPFHYGIKLCEELCKYAKKEAKTIDSTSTPSCLAFHKVRSSFIDDYPDLIEQELTAQNCQFNFGPYFLKKQEGFATIDQLKTWVHNINKKDAPKGPLRNWVSELRVSEERAAQMLTRIKTINKRKFLHQLGIHQPFTDRKIKGEKVAFTHIYDVLSLASI